MAHSVVMIHIMELFHFLSSDDPHHGAFCVLSSDDLYHGAADPGGVSAQ